MSSYRSPNGASDLTAKKFRLKCARDCGLPIKRVFFVFLTVGIIILSWILITTNVGTDENYKRAISAIDRLVAVDPEEKFLWYTPHSGFGNQLVSFRNALRVAGILNRTLIIPPTLEHKSGVMLGDCASNRIALSPTLRQQYWDHLTELIYSPSYTSMADVIDVSFLSPELVRTIDLRIFLSLKCGLKLDKSMAACSWCHLLVSRIRKVQKLVWNKRIPTNQLHAACAQILGVEMQPNATLPPKVTISVHPVDIDCRETVIVNSRDPKTGKPLDEMTVRPADNVQCPSGFSFPNASKARLQRSISKRVKRKLLAPKPLNLVRLVEGLNPEEARARVWAFGTMFSYFDFGITSGKSKSDEICCETEILPFATEIMKFAQIFAEKNVSKPFSCLHFRGGDMFYIKLINENILKAKDKLKKLKIEFSENQKAKDRSKLFLMSDLANATWRKNFDISFGSLGYDLRYPDHLQSQWLPIKQRVQGGGRGFLTNRLPKDEARNLALVSPKWWHKAQVPDDFLKNIGVVLEQAVCSCADQGFIGNELSTVSENVHRLITGRACLRSYD